MVQPPRQWTKIAHEGNVIDQRAIELTWDQVRKYRDRALASTDWLAGKDRTMTQVWKDYRQALRDLPQDHETANDAADNWPGMPDA